MDFWLGLIGGWRFESRWDRIRHPFRFIFSWYLYNKIWKKTVQKRELWIGPVYCEFGHILLHVVPFLSYAYHVSKIQKINICINEVYIPILEFVIPREALNISILPDLIGSYTPNSNKLPTNLNKDTLRQLEVFRRKMIQSSGFDLTDSKTYWNVFRNWHLQRKLQFIPTRKPCKSSNRPRIMLFPRKKGAETTANNGGSWDYTFLVSRLISNFDLVIAGHPQLSITEGYPDSGYVTYTWNNKELINQLMNCDLIITQHSGACILGDYFGLDTLIIYKGEGEIKGLKETMRFRINIMHGRFFFARTVAEIEDFLRMRFKNS